MNFLPWAIKHFKFRNHCVTFLFKDVCIKIQTYFKLTFELSLQSWSEFMTRKNSADFKRKVKVHKQL